MRALAGLAAVGVYLAIIAVVMPSVARDGAVIFAALAAAVGLVMAFGERVAR